MRICLKLSALLELANIYEKRRALIFVFSVNGRNRMVAVSLNLNKRTNSLLKLRVSRILDGYLVVFRKCPKMF